FDKKFAVQVVNRATQRVAQLVKLELRHVLALRHTQVRWSPDNAQKAADDWREEAAGFLAGNPDYLSIALYDSKMRLRAAEPPESENGWKGIAAARLQKAKGKPLYAAGRMEAQKGRQAALFILPLRMKGRNNGYIATAFDIDKVMPEILHVRDDRT